MYVTLGANLRQPQAALRQHPTDAEMRGRADTTINHHSAAHPGGSPVYSFVSVTAFVSAFHAPRSVKKSTGWSLVVRGGGGEESRREHSQSICQRPGTTEVQHGRK